ncbi:O-antigen ligase family protein [Halalkalibacterium halodurans]|uniref:O-antigen ligase family protein n=1 Tax=Halalkalibacterium halodurans TaxID=86665 RepID=UPI0002FA4464|nr:O-antigen ligase family protein [Halalkalibacterium halodurans]MED4170868.1 O-antigen ligase family protein [Halalkalibacterium halodurans]
MKVNTISSFLFAFSVAILINAPSIKVIFYSTEIVNILGTFLIIMVGILRSLKKSTINVNLNIILAAISITLLWGFLLISSFWSPEVVESKSIFQYLAVFVASLTMLLLSNKSDIKYYLTLQVVWSLFVALMHLTVGIQTDSSQGEHYLTIGLPIGIGLVISTGYIVKRINVKDSNYHVLQIVIFIMLLIGLITLRGRSPVIMSIITIYFFWVMLILKSRRKIIKNSFILTTITGIGLFIVAKFSSDIWLDRLMRFSDSSYEEPRIEIYQRTIKLISENILGYGLNSYSSITMGNYPHNIFLEITFYSGLIGLTFFSFFIWIFIKSVLKAITSRNFELITISMVAVYVLLIWNVSYSLSSTYVPFVALCFAVSTINKLDFDNRSVASLV